MDDPSSASLLAPASAPPDRRMSGTGLLGRWLTDWPQPCAVCRSWQAGRVCRDCLARFASDVHRCIRCALPLPARTDACDARDVHDTRDTCGACLRRPPSVVRTIAALDYRSPWNGLIAGFKFHRRPGLAALFAQRLQEAVMAQGVQPDCIVLPVPLSQARLRERGYNQAWEVARRLARSLHLRADPLSLLRIIDTPHQVGLPRDERLANVARAFAVDPLRRAQVAGRAVALVDDVMTTGATVEGAARALLQAGAASVQAWVVARADGR